MSFNYNNTKAHTALAVLLIANLCAATAVADEGEGDSKEEATIELTVEEARKCELCIDREQEARSLLFDIQGQYNKRVGQLDECRQTVQVLQSDFDQQGQQLGKAEMQADSRISRVTFAIPIGLTAILATGWAVDRFTD